MRPGLATRGGVGLRSWPNPIDSEADVTFLSLNRIEGFGENAMELFFIALSQNISTRSERPQVCSEVSQSRRRTDVLLSLSGVILSSNCHIPIHNNKQLSAASTQNSSNVRRFIVRGPKISVHSSFYSCPHEFSKNIIMCDLTFSNGGVFRFGLET